jgi:hypothetical protein
VIPNKLELELLSTAPGTLVLDIEPSTWRNADSFTGYSNRERSTALYCARETTKLGSELLARICTLEISGTPTGHWNFEGCLRDRA